MSRLPAGLPLLLAAMLAPAAAWSESPLLPPENPIASQFPDFAPREAVQIRASVAPLYVQRGGTLTVVLTGTVQAGSYVYAATRTGEGGPLPTTVQVDGAWLHPAGPTGESTPQVTEDAVFGTTLPVHRGSFRLHRAYRVAADAPVGDLLLSGYLRYQVCDGEVCSTERHLPFQAPVTVRAP